MASEFSVVETLPCPKCAGTGKSHIARNLRSLWAELATHLTRGEMEGIIASIEIADPDLRPTGELYRLAKELKTHIEGEA